MNSFWFRVSPCPTETSGDGGITFFDIGSYA